MGINESHLFFFFLSYIHTHFRCCLIFEMTHQAILPDIPGRRIDSKTEHSLRQHVAELLSIPHKRFVQKRK
jgi:hypothetical protein